MPNNTPVLQLMHDTVNPVNRIKQLVLILKKKEEFSNEPILDMIDKSADDLNYAIDAFYNASKLQAKEHDIVVLNKDVNGIKKGTQGTIVFDYGETGMVNGMYELEFVVDGKNIVERIFKDDFDVMCVHPYDSVTQDEFGHKCTKCGTQLTD